MPPGDAEIADDQVPARDNEVWLSDGWLHKHNIWIEMTDLRF
jgi:hypothetical protein